MASGAYFDFEEMIEPGLGFSEYSWEDTFIQNV